MAEKICLLLLLLMVSGIIVNFSPAYQLVENGKNCKNQALTVYNINTSSYYATIQEAIDAPQTLNGHIITVGSGVYFEHVTLDKSLTIHGEDPKTTIIDGGDVGTVVHINVDNVCITGLTVNNSGRSSPPLDCGILLDYCSGSNISGNIVTNCRYGIYLFHSYGNSLTHNNVSECYEDGVWLYHSGNNNLTGNKASSNRYNFGLFGASFSDFNNTIDTSNMVDEKPIQYLVGVSNFILNDGINTGCLYLINSENVTVTDLNLTKNGHGLFCWNTTDSRIENITSSENNYGIYLQSSDGNTVNHNFCGGNWVGIGLEDSTRNIVSGNNISDSEKGVSLYEADSNNVTENTLANNLYGIRLFASSFNRIFYNNMIENTQQVDLIGSYQNYWDNGAEGNFWSDFPERYPNASEIDGSGIWDTPYIIDEDNQDNYPLVPEFQIPIIILLFILVPLLITLLHPRSNEAHRRSGSEY